MRAAPCRDGVLGRPLALRGALVRDRQQRRRLQRRPRGRDGDLHGAHRRPGRRPQPRHRGRSRRRGAEHRRHRAGGGCHHQRQARRALPSVFGGLFEGEYWIVALGADYDYAVVTDGLQFTLFVLSRSPVMTQAQYQAILDELAAKQINTDFLRITVSSGLAP
ncbi:MAG: lipocalin family protein [Deltaproteobacteria bacterium]|nr:lipocalin family protein [Deltaproteobacteria bacterium]